MLMFIGSIVTAPFLFLILTICNFLLLFFTITSYRFIIYWFSLFFIFIIFIFFFSEVYFHINIATLGFFSLVFEWYIFSQSFYFYAILLFIFKNAFCRQHKIGSSFLHNLAFSVFHWNVIMRSNVNLICSK